jgi:nucleoside transporter
MQIAGVAGVVLGLYSFTLPNVPPPAAGRKVSFRDVVGVDAFRHLRSRSFNVFLACLLLTSIPLATYYAYVPVFLNAADLADPAFKMTFGQMSEVVFLLLMPLFFARFGVKRVLLIGMTAWAVRYGLFAIGASYAAAWIILPGIMIHGICYGFVYVAGQIYIDKKAPVTIRAQAQGLFVLVTYGLGQGMGTLVAGWIFNRVVTGGTLPEWQIFWIVPLAFATVVTIVFALFFKEDVAVEERAAPA